MQAATYYVATTGSDSNPGTSAAPFLTVSKGVSAAANPGDTVIVENGTYGNSGVVEPNYVVTLNHSGSSGNPITIKAQNRGQAILDSGNTSTSTTCNGAAAYFNLNNQAFVVIQGFVIQHACDAGIESNDSEHDITFRWNTIQYIANREVTDQYGRDGIYLNSSEYNFTFDGNVFHDIGRTSGTQLHFDHGIYGAATGLTIINNVFYNMTSGWSIQIDGGSNWLIANNTFAFPNTGDGEAGQIMFWNPISNITLENNIFYEPNTSALTQYAATMSGCTFTDNLIYGVSSIMNGSTTGMTVGTNQIGANPLFVNATTSPYNFALSPGSPAIGVALSLATVTDDLNGNTRPATPDLGAYQSAPAGPVISNVTVTSITSNSAYVNWTTSDASNSSVQYGTTGLTSTSAVNTSMVTTHSVEVAGLAASTTYQFRASSTDANGNVGVSTTSTFATTAPPVVATTFSVSAATPVSVTQGQSSYDQVSAALLTGNPAAVTFGVSSVAGLTTSFSTGSCTLGCTTTLTVSAASTITPGSYTLTVTGSGSGMAASANILVIVTAAAPVAPSAPTGVSAAGLMADWPLTASSGTVATDISGKGNTGTADNPYWWTSVHGPCLYFSGESSYVTVAESASLEEKTALTVAFWVDPNANSITDPRIIAKLYDWDVKLNGSSRHPQFETSSAYAELNYPMGTQTWYHVVFTFSNGVVTGYVNGVAVPFLANTFKSGNTLPQYEYGLYLGTDSSMTQNFVGSLAEVRIYNQALSASQVAALYASGQ